MKVIDLLEKIVNDEEVPKTIQLYTHKYQYWEDIKDYKADYIEDYWMIKDFIETSDDLTEEIKIIEETPKDKKIEYIEPSETMIENHINIMKKINEIIDYINKE